MGFLFADGGGDFKAKTEAAVLQQLGCRACPLNHTPGKIDATGSDRPLVYILGEAAGKDEEDERRQFVGRSGQLLRKYIPKQYLSRIRWNNTLNCHPPKNRDPDPVETACCRPRVEGDIERTKPKAILGFGSFPLKWVIGPGFDTRITYWRGRKLPVKVGNHACWYYPIIYPAFLLRSHYGVEEELRMFEFDIKRALAEAEHLPPPEIHTPEMARANVECLTKVRDIEMALIWASRQPHVGLDYETTALRPYGRGAKILTGAVGTLERAYSFPFDHPGSGLSASQVNDIKDLWQRFLLRAPCRKVVHSLAFEMEWSAFFFGDEVLRARPWEDTATAASILDERVGKSKPGCFSLEFLIQQYYGFNVKKVSAVNRAKLESTALDVVLKYNGIDAKYHDGLWEKQLEELEAYGLTEAYRLALRRVPTVVLSQLRGAPVDQAVVQQFYKKYSERVEDAEAVIFDLDIVKKFESRRGKRYNPYSGADLLYVLDDILGRPEVWVVNKYTKEETRSTEADVLERIDHPIAAATLALRGPAHNLSTYVEPLRVGSDSCVVFPDGLIHCQFNTYFAETGRFSSETPNMQNFPKRDAESKETRKPIAPGKGHVTLSADYGQIEARVIAMFTRDKYFCRALWERYDIHQDWAERIACDYPTRIGGKKMWMEYKSKSKEGKKVLKDFRTDIKNQWTFPLVFGATDKSVAGYLNIPLHIIKPHFRQFWKEFSGIADWQEEQLKFYEENGYVECLTKRRRRGPLSVNQIYNTPVQGTAMEIFADAYNRLSETGDPRLQPELNIHDDLTWLRVPESELEEVGEAVVSMMLDVPFPWVNVPISVELSVGSNWADLEEVGTFFSDTWKK